MTTMLEQLTLALAAEIERQIAPQVAEHKAGKWGSAQSHFSGPSALFGTCQINGEVDLRSVARAALEAIREPDETAERAGEEKDVPGFSASAASHWTAMIDGILNQESPPPANRRRA